MRTLPRMSAFFGLLILTGQFAYASPNLPPPRRAVTITEINLAWFGLGGDPANQNGEHRLPTIRKFFSDHNLFADVMVFEEIVNVNLLQQELLGSSYACHSYQRSDPKHQHVVICNKATFTFAVADDSQNFALACASVKFFSKFYNLFSGYFDPELFY